MDSTFPLPTLLSAALVAFTVEFDNEFEHLMPHRTTDSHKRGVRPAGPWLVSQVMFANVMQHVDEDGTTIDELNARARITVSGSLNGLTRWGYIRVESGVVRPTAAGRRAQEIWRPLASVVEQRWRDRFGRVAVRSLRSALRSIVDRIDIEMPQYVPVISPTQGGKTQVPHRARGETRRSSDADLSVLLAQTLLAFTVDFERRSAISLAVAADTLRLLTDEPIRVRDLPQLSGVSKEAQSMSIGFLERCDWVVQEPDVSAGRGWLIRLTPKGQKTAANYRRDLGTTEQEWTERFGSTDVARVRDAIEPLVGSATATDSPLFAGLQPYPGGWRASHTPPTTLPHHPMVLHRGGYPDGS